MKRFYTLVVMMLCILSANAQYGEYVGGDISILPLYEEHNSKSSSVTSKAAYLDGDGAKIDDLITWLTTKCGWNSFRVRIFVTPTFKDGKGNKDNCVCQDLDYVKKLGKRIKNAGANFVLDFHYSDSWADPSYQSIPSSWTDTSTDGLCSSISSYTSNVLKELKDYGAEPDFVQIGNEISYGMLWRSNSDKVYPAMEKNSYNTQWTRFISLLKSASKAVRDNSSAKIIVHIERSGNATTTKNFYTYIRDVDYDIIGLSYYPFYHGAITSLASTLTTLSTNFPAKKVQIVETSYPFKYYPSDYTKNPDCDFQKTWGASANGQYAYTKDLLTELAKHSNVNGLYWWQPEEAGNGDDTDWSGSTGATVMSSWMTRGLWWCDTNTAGGHWPVKADDGMVAYLMKNFLSTTAINEVSGTVNHEPSTGSKSYNLSGQQVDDNYKGIVIKDGKKIMK